MNDLMAALVLFIPRVLGAIAISVFGLVLASITQRAVTLLLRRLNFDGLAERLGITSLMRESGIKRRPSIILGTIVFWIILILALLTALSSLGLDFLAVTLNQVFLYTPRALAAILLLILGTTASGLMAQVVSGWLASARIRRTASLVTIVRYGIIFITVLLAASVMEIDTTIVVVITVIVLGGMALAAALALGLGLRDLSRHVAAGRYMVEGIAEGDRITIGTASGVVEEIGYAVTTIRGEDGRVFLVPNGQFMDHIVEKEERNLDGL